MPLKESFTNGVNIVCIAPAPNGHLEILQGLPLCSNCIEERLTDGCWCPPERWQWWMMMMMVDDGWWWWWWMMMSTKEESGHLVIETGKSRTGRGNQETVKGRVKATKSILWLNSQKLFSDKVYIAFSPPFIRTLLTSIIQPNIIQHYPPQSSTQRS